MCLQFRRPGISIGQLMLVCPVSLVQILFVLVSRGIYPGDMKSAVLIIGSLVVVSCLISVTPAGAGTGAVLPRSLLCGLILMTSIRLLFAVLIDVSMLMVLVGLVVCWF